MRKAFTSIFAAVSLLCVSASAVPVNGNWKVPQIKYADDKPMMVHQGEHLNSIILPASAKKKVARHEESGTSQLTLLFDYNEEEFYVSMVSVCWPGGEEFNFLMGEDEMTFENLPATEGIIIVPFSNVGVPNSPSSYYVIKPFTTYEGEGTMINVSPEEATATISFPSVLPDGSAPVLPTAPDLYSDNYDYTGSNVSEVGAYTTIGSDDYGTVYVIGTNQVCQSEDGMSGMENLDIRITPLGSDWHFSQSKWMVGLDGNIYFAHSAVIGTENQPQPNAPEFVEYKYNFAENPIKEIFPNEGEVYQGYGCEYMIDGAIDPMTFFFYSNKTYNYFMSAPVTADTETWTSDYGIMVMNVEYDVMTESFWGMEEDMRSLDSPLVMYDKDSKSLFFQNMSTILGGSPLWWNAEDANPQIYPGVMAYSSPANECKYPLGGTAPLSVATLEAYDMGDGDKMFFNSMSWLGLYSEVRGADGAISSALLKAGEEEEETTFDELNNMLMDYSFEGKLAGEFSIVVSNDRNVVVDGIQGYNVTTLNVAAGSNDDATPPTFTSMQFRNMEGNVDNQFASAEEGIIYLSGGDFVLVEGDITDYWECEGVEIKVEAAPYGSENYEEISMTEVPENYHMPIFGYFWQGSLKDITAADDNVWYVLRLTITDNAGNSQMQEIYPAFKIGGTSSVNGIDIDNSTLPVKYYNMQGMEIKNPEKGSMLIKKQGNETRKVIIK